MGEKMGGKNGLLVEPKEKPFTFFVDAQVIYKRNVVSLCTMNEK